MCTAISFLTKNHYFGRNLDLEFSYKEEITITPRNYPFQFCEAKTLRSHYAMIGMATIANNYPLYYDATNEFGLSMAGLNFPGNAVYHPTLDGMDNITPFELIPWILSQCKTISEARVLLSKINLVNIPFSAEYPLTPLHWIISDRNESLAIEPMESCLVIHENAVGVLTNSPPFDFHMNNLCNYLNVTAEEPANRFTDKFTLNTYSRGMGGIGLPGDLSSSSRFIKAAFTKLNSVCDDSETASISQFFHILGSVAQQRGCVKVNGGYEITLYSSCCNTDKGIYCYKTYDNSQITAVRLFRENLDSNKLIRYPLRMKTKILFEDQSEITST